MIISYNQESVIRRAIESLLCQRDYIYEICVSDDCSQDKTWDILQDYSKQYPGLFKLNRNEPNIGIYENIEKTWEMPTGDVVYRLAGDDECGKDYIKHVVDFIIEKGIDYEKDLFCIYGDYKLINADDSSIVYKNKLVTNNNAIKLKIRQLLSNRSACYSIKIVNKFYKVSEGRNHNAELVQESQLQILSEHNYYIPYIGNIYYAERGVSTRKRDAEYYKEIFERYDRMLQNFKDSGIIVDKSDLYYIKYMKAYRMKEWLSAFRFFINSIDPSLGLYGLQIGRIFFVMTHLIKHHFKKG